MDKKKIYGQIYKVLEFITFLDVESIYLKEPIREMGLLCTIPLKRFLPQTM